jgi:hypothetical protein
MSTWEEICTKLPLDYVNAVKDELRKINDVESAKQILGEAGVELGHVSGATAQLYWGSGIEQAKRQDVVKKVLDRANKISVSDPGSNLAKLIKEYNHAVISAAAEDGHDLKGLLAILDEREEPRKLHEIAERIRQMASQMRQRLDDDEQFRILPFQSEEFGGPSPDQVRERLTEKCYNVIVAADQVLRISRLLPSGSDDESWSIVTGDPMLQAMREQYAAREINKFKLTLVGHVRRLLRDLRTIPLEGNREI